MSENTRRLIVELVEDERHGIATKSICARVGRTPQDLGDVFELLIEEGKILGFAGLWLSPDAFHEFANGFLEALSQFHQANPSVILVNPEQIAKGIGWPVSGKPLDRMARRLEAEGQIYRGETGVRIRDFRPTLPDRHRDFLDKVKVVLSAEPVNTPTPHQISHLLHIPAIAIDEILRLGVDAGEIELIGDGVFYTSEQMALLEVQLRALAENHELSASYVRDAMGTTRKYAVALLTHFFPRPDSDSQAF